MNVRVRRVANSHVLTVPATIAGVVPEGARFEPRLTDDGILYRFVGTDADVAATEAGELPAWTEGSNDGR